MKRWLVLALMSLGCACGLRAQVTDTTVCDVVRKPETFNGKMVRIKGTVVSGFDEFIIKDAADPNCGFQVNGIWLQYPQGTKGKAGPAAILQIQPAHNFAGKYTAPTRTAVTLDKSKDFKQFDSLLAQTHQKGADMCLGCARYEVSATMVGRLDSVADATLKRDAAGKIVEFGGFGNMNAYPARLVLQSVADVTPKEIDYSKSDAASKGDAIQAPGSSIDLYTAVSTAQKIAASMGASPAKDELTSASGVYGKQGEHTGVYMSYGTTSEAGQKDDEMGTKDSPDGVEFNCTFNSDRLQGDALMRAVVHMGQHVTELRNPLQGDENAPAIVLESNGWVLTTIVSFSTGQKYLTLTGGYQIWNTSWPPDKRNDTMMDTLKDFLANEALLSR